MEILRENERQKQAKVIRERGKYLQIVNAVTSQGGVCTTKEDVNLLMEQNNRVEI